MLLHTPTKCLGREVLGSVAQQMSWITSDDLLAGTLHSLTDDSVHGPVNAVTPYPVSDRESTKTLGSILLALVFAARMLLIEKARALFTQFSVPASLNSCIRISVWHCSTYGPMKRLRPIRREGG